MTTDSKLPLTGPSVEAGSPAPGPQEVTTALLDPPAESASTAQHEGLQLWLHRVSVFLFVLISAVAGVLLIILPWTPEWTDNYLLLSYPSLRTLVSSGFFRGFCTGLGLLDIWIGFWEALHYHEHR
ncbi:MAG TPA: hypothetical protein VKR60_13615 [Candidatus Sulfotelmatobacter sp.]|nr:hypothetical protein [Candidatus Sulfotelmatobacter sp.]